MNASTLTAPANESMISERTTYKRTKAEKRRVKQGINFTRGPVSAEHGKRKLPIVAVKKGKNVVRSYKNAEKENLGIIRFLDRSEYFIL